MDTESEALLLERLARLEIAVGDLQRQTRGINAALMRAGTPLAGVPRRRVAPAPAPDLSPPTVALVADGPGAGAPGPPETLPLPAAPAPQEMRLSEAPGNIPPPPLPPAPPAF